MFFKIINMLAATSCRLCFSCDNCDDYLNIFGTTGDGLRINDMISEHFRCDVNKTLTFTPEMNATLIGDPFSSIII